MTALSLRSLRGLVSVAFLSLLFVSCKKDKSLELNMPSMPSSGGTAVYALSINAGTCMNADVQGAFTKNMATTAANKVNVEVSVNTIGSWTVNSATITGFYFSGSGNFTATGTQNITLQAHGTPNTSGIQTFTLIVGGSNCTFEVNVDDTGGGNNLTGDYFPTTQNSWWSYDEGAGDTSKTVVSGTGTYLGKTYQRFINSYSNTTSKDTTFYRKDVATGFYYIYTDLSDLASSGIVMTQPQVELLFLKNSLTTGATWNNDFLGTFTGSPVTIRFKFTCINAAATVTANGNTFNNVYQVEMKVQAGVGPIFQDVATPVTLYFAKDVGNVKSDDGTNVTTLRYWHIY